ncbi:methyltransferase domain-containing protein [Wenzhouxiangella sediminis]|uniref:Methyltransferase domain-containing protein n=2 Tax=Wenzhouxiangella sediminis TaxID=1792836 RepID=A0A3E1KAU0_9GAMM|nr:methyltransferase domain-containing protein [Wenzhouxiangella sediminis]
MHPLVNRAIRSALQRGKSMLRATRAGRSLLYDLNNRHEFTSLLSHERMLADRVRVDAYHEAIRRHVHPGQTVIDLGTGTGILAMFAARQSRARVYALDHSDFLGVARRAARHNGLDGIEFVKINSREFTPPQRVDLVIHEQIGDELLTENMLDNLLDLKKRCLKPEGRILPAVFELFLEPVQLRSGRRIPYLWEEPVHGLDFGILRNDRDAERFKPPDYDCYLLEPSAFEMLLCKPRPLLTFDLNRMDSPRQLGNHFRARKTASRPGRMDGLALYFRVVFDQDLSFDTSPLSAVTHWRSRLFRVPARRLETGESFEIELDLPDPTNIHSWRMRILESHHHELSPQESATQV